MNAPISVRIAEALERGRLDGRIARACAAAWSQIARRTVVRHLPLPPGTCVVAVGGSTLGGSGKTPLAIACATELAAAGHSVALVGHAHRARPNRPRVVSSEDLVAEVGDEALVAARALAPFGARVVVAPRRSAAVAFAARESHVLVLDGVAQTAPARASLSLLAVDRNAPWGAGAVPPAGDLRAPVRDLLAACDALVTVDQAGSLDDPFRTSPRLYARAVSPGAEVNGQMRTWPELSRERVGLLSLLARPERVRRALATRSVDVRAIVRVADHGPIGRDFWTRVAYAEKRDHVALWLATPKCAVHFERPTGVGRSRWSASPPVGVIEYRLVLSDALRDRLHDLAAVVSPLAPALESPRSADPASP